MSKSNRRSLNNRLKKLQKRIDVHKLGTEHVFLDGDDVTDFIRKNNTDLLVFEYMTICPILRMGEQFADALDILEKNNVPNIHLFKDLIDDTKPHFLKRYDDAGKFVPFASAYILTHAEDAIEDVVRRLPLIKQGGDYGMIPNPPLSDLLSKPEVKARIEELGLDYEMTLQYMGYWFLFFPCITFVCNSGLNTYVNVNLLLIATID